MSIKCECCRFYGKDDRGATRVLVPGMADRSPNIPVEFCSNDLLCSNEIKQTFPNRKGLPLDYAVNICKSEASGHLLFFEPKHPQAGACFVQIQPLEKPRAMAAAAGDPFSRRGAF